MLESECRSVEVETVLNCQVLHVEKPDGFKVSTTRGDFQSDALVIATGGLSVPPSGASPWGYEVACRFGLQVTPLRPALVPLILSGQAASLCRELSGVSLEVAVQCGKTEFRGNMLFTHRGLSGPAIIQISSYWTPGETLHINLLPGMQVLYLFEENRHSLIELKNLLGRFMPKRFAEGWTSRYLDSIPLRHYSDAALRQMAHQIEDWEVRPSGTEGYKTAEVTLGGVDTAELSSKTMESKKVSGLYFIGEVVDVTGQLGGYNFQWAWSSGFAAGQYV
jgi:hypothetical protein